jgi:hypothetical protein
MRQALLLTAALTVAFLMVERILGIHIAAALGFGSVAVIAVVNALTFLWLWWARTTPLALGMTCSWLGQAALSIWGFFVRPDDLALISGSAPLVFFLLSLYVVGGALHIAVMQSSMELRRTVLIWPVLAVLAVATTTAIAL